MDKPVRLRSRSKPLHASIWPTAFKLDLQFKEGFFLTNLKKSSMLPKLCTPLQMSWERGVCLCVCLCLKLPICINQGSAQFGAEVVSFILLSIMHIYGTI